MVNDRPAGAADHVYLTGYRPLDAPRRPDLLPATFGQRTGALLLDAVVAFVCVPVPIQVFFLLTGRGWQNCTWVGNVEVCVTNPEDARLSRILFWSLATLFALGFSWVVSRRRTFGQQAVGMRIGDAATGEPVPFGRALLRTVAMVISAVPIGLGFWWALWDRDGRTWHDRIARTRAIAV